MTSRGPSVVRTASFWASFRSARYWSGASVGTPSMLAAEAEPPAEGEPAGGEGRHLDQRVPHAFVIRRGGKHRERDGDGRSGEQHPGTVRQAHRKVVEDITGIARNGRLDGGCVAHRRG